MIIKLKTSGYPRLYDITRASADCDEDVVTETGSDCLFTISLESSETVIKLISSFQKYLIIDGIAEDVVANGDESEDELAAISRLYEEAFNDWLTECEGLYEVLVQSIIDNGSVDFSSEDESLHYAFPAFNDISSHWSLDVDEK